ncbi:unnamed protein product [marine sediment metagenome]|uniref:Uncharacterized protein n=1 Tax=marine sediment metagenome TaxID=412755 RepID=X1BXS0_9ZZZZ
MFNKYFFYNNALAWREQTTNTHEQKEQSKTNTPTPNTTLRYATHDAHRTKHDTAQPKPSQKPPKAKKHPNPNQKNPNATQTKKAKATEKARVPRV